MKITVFGDILWDIFPDKREIGGAAFNFAAHMAQLGAEVKMLSALGTDPEGDDALAEAQKFGVDLDGVARVSNVPTGRSLITLTNGTPDYVLPFPAAYDCVPLPRRDGRSLSADALYFGTLPVRSPDYPSRASLLELFAGETFRELFFDINIRKQYYTEDFVDLALSKATILKLSRDEQDVVSKVAGLDGANTAQTPSGTTPADQRPEQFAFCRALVKRYPNLRIVLLTLDKDGAVAYNAAENMLYVSEKPDAKVVSTVGGGDSLSACFLYNYLRGEPVDVCLARASVLANYVVSHLGAIPAYTDELLARIR